MRSVIVSFAIFALFQFVGSSAFAFNKAGHMVTAALAYSQLSPDAQQRVTVILKDHPDAAKWQQKARTDVPGLDLGVQLLMEASAWPDEIRAPNNPHNRVHHHPTWHYINYPLRAPGFEQSESIGGDLLVGIERCTAQLSDATTAPADRAIALCWLVHLIGDLHQPLHTVAMMGEQWPHGDKGGNDFWVRPAKAPVNLHSFWDGALGRSTDPREAKNDATRLKAQFPASALKELTKAQTPREWTLESRAVAVEKAYLRGKLKGGSKAADAVTLPQDYGRAMKPVAERRVALAGCRLVKLIDELLVTK